MELDPGSPATPAVVEDLSGRAGLDEMLLGTEVALPQLSDPDIATVRLEYTHFSVLMRPDRRLAAVSGVGIDGARLVDLDRAGIDWRFDPRIPAGHQVGDPVYAGNDLDRGHLTRRADAVWGDTAAEAQLGNSDTFHFTNAAPQAAEFNQGQLLWQGLEDYLLDNAATYDRRLVVFTGPVLDRGDPTYRGVQLPLRFYKVAAFIDGDEPRTDLAATGYVLDQTPLVEDLPEAFDEAEAAGQPPPLGPFRTFQVPIGDIAGLTGLALGQLAAVDRFATVTADASDSGWVQLQTLDDIRW